jgi:hypothetical protein
VDPTSNGGSDKCGGVLVDSLIGAPARALASVSFGPVVASRWLVNNSSADGRR